MIRVERFVGNDPDAAPEVRITLGQKTERLAPGKARDLAHEITQAATESEIFSAVAAQSKSTGACAKAIANFLHAVKQRIHARKYGQS